LNLVGAARYSIARRPQQVSGPTEPVGSLIGNGPHAKQFDGEFTDLDEEIGGDQLANRTDRTRRHSGGRGPRHALRGGGRQGRKHVDIGEPLSDNEIAGNAQPLGQPQQLAEGPTLSPCAGC
jgi:hypothetical protein